MVNTVRELLDRAGLRGSFLVRDLHSGTEVAIDADDVFPIASLIKVPIAVATLERIRRGELSGAQRLTLPPGRMTAAGPTGVSRFRHPSDIALDDVLYLSTSLSDGSAADALLELTPPDRLAAVLAELGMPNVRIRHRPGDLSEPVGQGMSAPVVRLAHQLAVTGRTADGGHGLPLLAPSEANAASARDVSEWLENIWAPRIPDDVAQRTRDLMLANVHRTRLAPEFTSDATTWWSKTGTLLNLRHDAGVVEHDDGSALAVVALTESRVASGNQPAVDALMGHIARMLHDEVRRRTWA